MEVQSAGFRGHDGGIGFGVQCQNVNNYLSAHFCTIIYANGHPEMDRGTFSSTIAILQHVASLICDSKFCR